MNDRVHPNEMEGFRLSDKVNATGNWDPMLWGRVLIDPQRVEDFDRWEIETHMPDLMLGPGIGMVVYFSTVNRALPQAMKGQSNRALYYAAPHFDGLMEWFHSDDLQAAIKDGSQFFPDFRELDGDVFTGNVYHVDSVYLKDSSLPLIDAPLWVERFEVAEQDNETFLRWARQYAGRLLAEPFVQRVRVMTAQRHDIPISYYLSIGNIAVMADLTGVSVPDGFHQASWKDSLSESMRWDTELEYVSRELFTYLAHSLANRPVGTRRLAV
jgi:hypothetical protein